MDQNDVSRMFYQDIREKKKAANGVHSKTGKRGYVGKMLFPSDIMNRKEKYNYRRAGKVTTTNIYDKILTIDEFTNLEKYEQKNMLQYWRTQYKNDDIRREMKISNKTFYDLINTLELPVAKRGGTRRSTKRKIEAAQQETPAVIEKPTVQEIVINGLHLSYNGCYSPEHIQNQLLKFATILENESDSFYIELKISQKPQ